ncbi:MAG TPA: SWIM zinc finger family protein [Candidatus Binataceae bacterium]|jgi:uncharacterized Zn finger protein|nr:SWIM zinc finger family protein [Candidatus Binataceae bacterium]
MARDWDDDDRWWRYLPSRPLAAKGGIKARSQRGAFAGSWWGKRWITVLESFGLGGRLTRGRSYARSGQVVDLQVTPGVVNATVQGSRADPYKVKISLKKIERGQRAALGKALAADMSMAAGMISGQLPPAVEKCFEQAGAPLFPQRSRDLVTWCSCPDSSNPCKHIAAVYYILAEEFDRDPFLLMALRGLGRDEFMALLGTGAPEVEAAQAGEVVIAPQPQPLRPDPQSFWRAARLPDLTYGDVAPVDEAAPMARRLGPFPLWRGATDFLEEVGALSRTAAARALQVLDGEAK